MIFHRKLSTNMLEILPIYQAEHFEPRTDFCNSLNLFFGGVFALSMSLRSGQDNKSSAFLKYMDFNPVFPIPKGIRVDNLCKIYVNVLKNQITYPFNMDKNTIVRNSLESKY